MAQCLRQRKHTALESFALATQHLRSCVRYGGLWLRRCVGPHFDGYATVGPIMAHERAEARPALETRANEHSAHDYDRADREAH